jgi:polar amino acid transport system permease protein
MSVDLIFAYLVSPVYARGALMTLALTICSLLFGILVGLIIALLQETKTRVAQVLTLIYLWLFRGTPVLFQIIFVYNVLPSFGIRLSAFVSGVLALSLNEGAYMAEILRSGLQAVKPGQRTAGLALGMTGAGVMRHIVIPQAARIVLPPIGNQMIGMLKLSALVSVIAVEDILLVANQTASANFRYLEALTAAGIYYLAMTTVFMALLMMLERALDPKLRRRTRSWSLTQRLLATSNQATTR